MINHNIRITGPAWRWFNERSTSRLKASASGPGLRQADKSGVLPTRGQRWPTVAVRRELATTTVGHRCRRNRIYGPPLLFADRAKQQRWPTVVVAKPQPGH